jgi:prepilin-type N-terminal cleavage/methylation domain-containing protein
MRNAQRGFSLLESLISLFLFLLIVLFCCDCFISVRNHFSKLKESETSNTAAYAALDRMRRDLLDAGLGLAQALELRILEGISEEQGALVVLSKSEELAVEEALAIGQQRIPTTDAKKVKRGQQIAIMNSTGGEVHIVASVDQNSFVIGSPLSSNYVQEDTNVVLLRKISLLLDENNGVIRRKINASPAQPLLEDVASFEFAYIRDANLVKLAVRLKIDEERKYETTVFPKNTGMASLFWEN